MFVFKNLSPRWAFLALLILLSVSAPGAAFGDDDRDWREREKDRREAIREWEKDRRENAREWEKDRQRAAREAARDRWERNRDDGRRGRYERDRDWRYDGPRGAGYGRLAFSQGYQDGFDKGREDSRKRRSASLSRHERYRDADHGYKSDFGAKSQYRLAYRNGFEQGYSESYGRWWR